MNSSRKLRAVLRIWCRRELFLVRSLRVRRIQRHGVLRGEADHRGGGALLLFLILGLSTGENNRSRLRVASGSERNRSLALFVRPQW